MSQPYPCVIFVPSFSSARECYRISNRNDLARCPLPHAHDNPVTCSAARRGGRPQRISTTASPPAHATTGRASTTCLRTLRKMDVLVVWKLGQPRPQWWSTHRPPQTPGPDNRRLRKPEGPRNMRALFRRSSRYRGPRFRLENRLESTGQRSDAVGRRRAGGYSAASPDWVREVKNAQRSTRASVPRSTPSRATPINRVQELPTAGLDKGRVELLDRDPRVGTPPWPATG